MFAEHNRRPSRERERETQRQGEFRKRLWIRTAGSSRLPCYWQSSRDHKMITTLRNHKNTHTHMHALYTCPQVPVEVRCDLESSWSVSFFWKKEKMQESCTTFVFVTLDPMNRRCCWHTCERAGRRKKDPKKKKKKKKNSKKRLPFPLHFLDSLSEICLVFLKLPKQGNDRILPSFFFFSP